MLLPRSAAVPSLRLRLLLSPHDQPARALARYLSTGSFYARVKMRVLAAEARAACRRQWLGFWPSPLPPLSELGHMRQRGAVGNFNQAN
ncbi:hypothetical protein BRADI_1g56735v3 [Brachypodium distachyon]|uniref:Uncharacterized protein n=1 Tax=Brachypodium distachyon TaxID=15368 RepID=A0A2K2DRU1_BRADI|nr:hypothetical protein BRADI_1g56735v3 [Brachypodium distachyon]